MQEKELINAETSLAGAIVVDARCLELVPKDLEASDFQDERCAAVYTAARALERKGEQIDPVTIRDWAKSHGTELSWNFLSQLMNITPSTTGAGNFAESILQDSLRRQAQAVFLRCLTDENTPVEQIASDSAAKLSRILARASGCRIITMSDVPPSEPRWLLKPYFQRGKGTLIQADPGTGKTAFMCAVAAAVSTGRDILGLPVQTPGPVLILSVEDDYSLLRGRLEANGADLNNVYFYDHPEEVDMLSPRLEDTIQKLGAKLVILDPLQAFLGSEVDMFRANETRPILSRFMAMLDRCDCSAAIIAHLSKATQGKSAVNQSLGSVDIPGIMRSILHLTRDPRNREMVHAVHIKSSNAAAGKTISFTIGDRGGVTFTELSDLTLDRISRGQKDLPQRDVTEDLLPVLARLGRENPPNTVHTFAALKEACMKELYYIPYASSREAGKLLSTPALQKKLLEEYHLCIRTNVRTASARGFRLLPWHELTQ